MKRGLLLVVVLATGACVTTQAPIEEYNISAIALEAAKEAEAGKYGSGYFHKAQEAYRRGQILFKAREYDKAKTEFLNSRSDAEKAENMSRLIQWKNGEVF
jgi:hypothetical protein